MLINCVLCDQSLVICLSTASGVEPSEMLLQMHALLWVRPVPLDVL